MNIMEVLNQPQIKIDALKKGGNSAPRKLIMTPLDLKDPVSHISTILKQLSSKFIDGRVQNIKVIDEHPLIFNIVPEEGADYYQVTAVIPANLDGVQKGLITSIERFMNPAE